MSTTSILDGVRILDLSRFIAGPLCCQMLGDMGAAIIKVETLEGEAIRHNAPLDNDRSVYSNIFNRNKRSISLNPRSTGGRMVLKDLAKTCDVVVENFRPGVINDMGLGFDELQKMNPKTSLISISGFGQTGPNRDRALFDATGQAETGLMSLTGDADGSPAVAGTFVVDHIAGYHAVMAVLGVLRHAESSGMGQHVDVAAFDAMFASMGIRGIWAGIGGDVPGRNGAQDVLSSPTDAFPCSDGYIYIQAGTSATFKLLSRAIGRPELADDPRFSSMRDRMLNADAATEIVTGWTSRQTVAEATEAMRAFGVPYGEVAELKNVVRSKQVLERGLIKTVNHPVSGELTVYAPTIRFGASPLQIQLPPPLVGEHTIDILRRDLQYSTKKISQLQGDKAVFQCNVELAVSL